MNRDYNFIVKLTLLCPGNCKCCKSRQDNFLNQKGESKFFDINVFKKICENIIKLGGTYVCLSGGEPTIVPAIDEYINVAHKYGLAVRLNTNGWGITEEKLQNWLCNGLDQVVLSVYSLNPKVFYKTRGNQELFERTKQAAEILKNARKKHKFMYIMQTIIMQNNYEEIPELLAFAIDNLCDRFWPSYLEDAINLPDMRMSNKMVKEFRNVVLPRMKKVISQKIPDKNKVKELFEKVEQYYSDKYDNYIYHQEGETCPRRGAHFTFYPNGVIDPCPGHEYFASLYQYRIDYNNIDEFMNIENLKRYERQEFDYCKYCPQGKHIEMCINKNNLHEHASRDEL